jgi:MFS family permease
MAARGRSRFFYGHVITAAGFLIWLIGWGSFTPSFSVFLKPLIAEFGWSRADASLAYSLSFLSQAGFAVIMGWLTDRLGPRLVITVLGSCLGLCYLLLSQVTTLWQFQALYALLGGLGMSTLSIPVMVTVSRWFVKKRAFTIGIVQAGMGIGGLIFPPLAGYLILAYGWRDAYVVYGLINLVGIFVAGLALRRDPSVMDEVPDGRENADQVSREPAPGTQPASLSLRKAAASSQFWIIAGLYAVFGFCRSTYVAHVPAHVQDLGFSLVDGANVLAVVWGASMFGRVGMGRMADRMGNRPTFIVSFLMTTASLFLVLIGKELWIIYLFAFIFGVAWGNQAVLRFSVASEVFGVASLGLIVGILGVAESSAATLGSYIAGYIFDISGTYTAVFWMGILLSATAALLAGLLKPGTAKAG